ncbi:site-specific integrase [Actinoplanes sichuanensis]|nr:site-specific integrase [Actinoplanes sichuanensis]
MAGWRVFWVPEDDGRVVVRKRAVGGLADLAVREAQVGIVAGDPIFLSPEYRVDPVLGLYGRSRRFRGYTAETRRNYATDIGLLLTFLSGRDRVWTAATQRDIEDYEHWRRFADVNSARIGGSKWDRELAAFVGLYRWAVTHGHVRHNPVAMKQVVGWQGDLRKVPVARAKDSRPTNVHWLTPRTWRRWIDIGLRGHDVEGRPEPGWVGRLEDRNVAFVRLLISSGLRRAEAGSLLRFEVPARQLAATRYYRGTVAAEVTRSKKRRTFYVAADAVGLVEAYVEASRAWAVRQAQQQGRYEAVPGRWAVTEVTAGRTPIVHYRDVHGAAGSRRLDDLTVRERMRLYTEGPRGLEPVWLWLNEQGLPFRVHSWEGVFTAANRRCARVLVPRDRLGQDPHRVFAPYATPHSARHSFALFMLVVLDSLMDVRYGLSPQERRDFRLLYGDPWFMVQCLLGHASRETTVERYLAPVADLQLRSMLTGVDEPATAPMPELDALFTRIARQSEGIQDLDERMRPTPGERR